MREADALPPEQAESEMWRVDVVLDSLDVPEPMRGRQMQALSGGWQRLALIARVWVTDPDVLFGLTYEVVGPPGRSTLRASASWRHG